MDPDNFVRVYFNIVPTEAGPKLNVEVSAPDEWKDRIGEIVRTNVGFMIPIDVNGIPTTTKSGIHIPKIELAAR